MSEIVAETKEPPKPTKCKVCYRDIPEDEPDQYNASMYYRKPFTCSTSCFNLYWIRDQPVASGWMPLVWSVYNKLNKLYGTGEWRVAQIKEKFGGLRFYFNPPRDEDGYAGEAMLEKAWEIVGEAEAESYKTCETCGEPGVVREGSWVRTLCDDDADGREPAEGWYNE